MTDEARRNFVLLVLDEGASGREVPLPLDRPFRFGRKSEADLPLLNDPKVSGVHAQLEFDQGHWILRDLDSTNGTFIDGRKVKEVPIDHGDIFQIGATRIQLVDKALGVPSDEDMGLEIGKGMLEKSAKKKGSLVLVLLLLVLVGGAAAWYFLGQGGTRKQKRKVHKVVRLEGDLLGAGAATLEGAGAEGAWARLQGGADLGIGGSAHSGQEALHVSFASRRGVDSEEGGAALFAAAILARPLPIGQAQAYEARAFVQTHGELKVGLRLLFFREAAGPERNEETSEGSEENSDDSLFRERPDWVMGKPLQVIPGAGYKELKLQSEVPFGATRVAIALVALPEGSGEAWADFDDMALVPREQGVALVQQFAGRTVVVPDEARSTLMVRVGQRVLLRSAESLPPASGATPGMRALASALGLPLGEFFSGISLKRTEGGVVFDLVGEGRLRLLIPQEALEGGTFLLNPKNEKGEALGFDRFGPGTQVKGFRALAIGEESSRMLLRPKRGGALSAQAVPGGVELVLDAPSTLTFLFDFEEQIRLARKYLREGEAAEEAEEFGKALQAYRRVLREVPFYGSAVRSAGERRARLLNRGKAVLDRLSESFEDARFLGYLGLFQELLARIDRERALFQGTELEARFAELKEKTKKARDSILATRSEATAKDLGEVFDALVASGSPRLAAFLGEILETSYGGTEASKTRKEAIEKLLKQRSKGSGKQGK
ncbi:MAG TPA: FHA domain-containing protein [Planctomycetes bacterium]|nr:FHA domain-containing protein [Planctomycetota bacterium]